MREDLVAITTRWFTENYGAVACDSRGCGLEAR
jgi:hypothetical protein